MVYVVNNNLAIYIAYAYVHRLLNLKKLRMYMECLPMVSSISIIECPDCLWNVQLAFDWDRRGP